MILPITLISLLLLQCYPQISYSNPSPFFFFSSEESQRSSAPKLKHQLVGDDGRVYACSGRNFYAFESNGSIAWKLPLNHTCSPKIAPVNGGSTKIYVVAEDRVLKINPLKAGGSESAIQLFFGAKPIGGGSAESKRWGEIVGIAVSVFSSRVLITVKRRGLFAYRLQGKLAWSAGPIKNQHGFRQGCRKTLTDCHFTSAPVIDHCEARAYVLNNLGELYAVSTSNPHFLWITDLSSFGNISTITAGNNGLVYVTVPTGASLILAIDASKGNILWQGSIGPLSTADYTPVVDSNGWVSVGSLDGFMYSFSQTGVVKKFPRVGDQESVIQVRPILDCSGFVIYVSQTEMDGKVSQRIGDYTYISAMKPRSVTFTMLVPATGSLLLSEKYPGPFSSKLLNSDLKNFDCDEKVVLAFFAASRINDPFQCISKRQKYAFSCSHIRPMTDNSIYTDNERGIILFLLFESTLLLVLAALVRFCCLFWKKKKLQSRQLGEFLEKRRALQLQKKAFDRTISELEQKATEEVVGNEVIEELGDLVREREGIERKLSTTYSFGRDETTYMRGSKPVLLPLSDRRTGSYSFQDRNKENITLFHTVTDASSEDSQLDIAEAWISSDDVNEGDDEYEASPSSSGPGPGRGVGCGSFDGIEESALATPQCVLKRRMRPLSSSS